MDANWMTPNRPCTAAELATEGIVHGSFETADVDASMARIKEQRKSPRDELLFLTRDNPNHEGGIAKEADEHAHMGEEVRLVLEGSAVYEVRARDDRVIQLKVAVGEFVVIPEGRYHRFLLDGQTVKCQQLFAELRQLMPFYRASNDETRTV